MKENTTTKKTTIAPALLFLATGTTTSILLLLVLLEIRMAASLSCVARYAVVRSSSSSSAGTAALRPFSLVISSGSVVDFVYGNSGDTTRAAIVNAANEACLGGGGVDGAISDAGGPTLLADRLRLPILNSDGAGGGGTCGNGDDDNNSGSSGSSGYGGDIRCRTGDAVITGPGRYGTLGVPYVIHAVGPNYMSYGTNLAEGDELLRGAYRNSLERAKEAKLEAVAFSLISSGVFRGRHSKREVLKIGVKTITAFDPYDELKEVYLCAFNAAEERLLCDICEELGLAKERKD